MGPTLGRYNGSLYLPFPCSSSCSPLKLLLRVRGPLGRTWNAPEEDTSKRRIGRNLYTIANACVSGDISMNTRVGENGFCQLLLLAPLHVTLRIAIYITFSSCPSCILPVRTALWSLCLEFNFQVWEGAIWIKAVLSTERGLKLSPPHPIFQPYASSGSCYLPRWENLWANSSFLGLFQENGVQKKGWSPPALYAPCFQSWTGPNMPADCIRSTELAVCIWSTDGGTT